MMMAIFMAQGLWLSSLDRTRFVDTCSRRVGNPRFFFTRQTSPPFLTQKWWVLRQDNCVCCVFFALWRTKVIQYIHHKKKTPSTRRGDDSSINYGYGRLGDAVEHDRCGVALISSCQFLVCWPFAFASVRSLSPCCVAIFRFCQRTFEALRCAWKCVGMVSGTHLVKLPNLWFGSLSQPIL